MELIDLTAGDQYSNGRISSQDDEVNLVPTSEVIDLTSDVDEPRRCVLKRQLSFSEKSWDNATQLSFPNDATTHFPDSVPNVYFYCERCHNPIRETAVLRICGCLYCKSCNANAITHWGRDDFMCNILYHGAHGNHLGRRVFSLDSRCPICQQDFEHDTIVCLECGHTFHEDCLMEWLMAKASCPHCRVECIGMEAWEIRSMGSNLPIVGNSPRKRKRLA